MNRNTKGIGAIVLLVVVALMVVACGGNADALKGTWEGTYEDGNATWTFDGKGACTLTNVFSDNLKGSYTIKDSNVEIKLDGWDNAKTYQFKIDGSALKLTASDPYSPNYELKKK
ncbi:DUF5640 domain-containing protein [Eubacteriales bacterium OttesenSCG-928-M02]|nr:DUF5640 domain-containing protein [Eubacteriales bacterium OttesenSCG-928-M02]